MRRSWQEALELSKPFIYEAFFTFAEGEEELYGKLLLSALTMDEDEFLRALRNGGEELLKRYNPEDALFGIHLFHQDLARIRKHYFEGRQQDAFYSHLGRFARWAELLRIDDIPHWISQTPYYEEFLEKYRTLWWVAAYRAALGSLPEAWRETLEPIARKIADFRSFQESEWMRADGTREEKDLRIVSKYEEIRQEIGQMLVDMGLSPSLATPVAFSPEITQEIPHVEEDKGEVSGWIF